jgi:uncharacterized phiE125 gp8 family phage protein
MSDLGHIAIVPVSTGSSTGVVLSAADLRDHLRLPTSTEDALLEGKIAAALRKIESRIEGPLLRAQYDQAIDRFPCGLEPILLRRSPGVSVDRVTSYGTTGGATVLSTDAYFLDTYSVPPRLCLNSGYTWPTGTRKYVAGVIRFTAGYSTSASSGIPDPLVEAMKKLATELYENREASSLGNSVNEPLPFGVEELLSEFVQPEFG